MISYFLARILPGSKSKDSMRDFEPFAFGIDPMAMNDPADAPTKGIG